MKCFRNTILCLSLLTMSYACSDDDNKSSSSSNSTATETAVVDTLKVDQIKTYYRTYLTQMQSFVPVDIETEVAKVKYDVAFTTVQYSAVDPFGNVRSVSGLVGYPVLPEQDKNKSLEIASLQHGTLTYPEQAPSKETFADINPVRDILMLVLPSLEKGYILAMPDYFGYGIDQNNLHYYEHRATLAGTSRGLIESIPDYAKNKSLNINSDTLFLLGYSEGGFATISTLKSFSETTSQFKNFVTVAGAGAYDKVKTATDVVQQTTGDDPKFIASYSWVLLTYNNVYKTNRPLNQLFQDAVVPELEKYTDNNNIMLSDNLPLQPNKVFSQTFAQGLADKTDTEFMTILNDNNVSDFAAKGSISLVHGAADSWVPTFNTDSTYARLSRRGVDINKTIVPGGTHATTYAFFALEALNKMK